MSVILRNSGPREGGLHHGQSSSGEERDPGIHLHPSSSGLRSRTRGSIGLPHHRKSQNRMGLRVEPEGDGVATELHPSSSFRHLPCVIPRLDRGIHPEKTTGFILRNGLVLKPSATPGSAAILAALRKHDDSVPTTRDQTRNLEQYLSVQ